MVAQVSIAVGDCLNVKRKKKKNTFKQYANTWNFGEHHPSYAQETKTHAISRN